MLMFQLGGFSSDHDSDEMSWTGDVNCCSSAQMLPGHQNISNHLLKSRFGSNSMHQLHLENLVNVFHLWYTPKCAESRRRNEGIN